MLSPVPTQARVQTEVAVVDESPRGAEEEGPEGRATGHSVE